MAGIMIATALKRRMLRWKIWICILIVYGLVVDMRAKKTAACLFHELCGECSRVCSSHPKKKRSSKRLEYLDVSSNASLDSKPFPMEQ